MERTANAEPVGSVDQGRTKFPSNIVAIGPDGKNYEISCKPTALPQYECESIIRDIATDFFGTNAGGVENHLINLKFDGKSYPVETTLEEIHEEVDLNRFGCVTAEFADAAIASMELKKVTGENGYWWVDHRGGLRFESIDYESASDAEEFIKNFSGVALLKNIEVRSTVDHTEYPNRGKTPPPPSYSVFVYIDSSEVKTLCDALAAREIRRAAPLLAQAIRNPGSTALAMLPMDVLCRLGPFLAPRLDQAQAWKLTNEKISEAEENFMNGRNFLDVEPVHADDVRASIGATSCLLLAESPVTREQAEKLENIAAVDFSSMGMVIKFPDKSYARRFFHGLKNSGYSSVAFEEKKEQTKFGNYEANVSVKNLNDVKNFLESVCGYGTDCMRDLCMASKDAITLGKDFFIKELLCIGELDSLSTEEKKEKAKDLFDKFVSRLNPHEAAELQKEISTLARPDAQAKPGPLQFLRELTGLISFLPGDAYSDGGTYKTIQAAIAKHIPKST